MGAPKDRHVVIIVKVTCDCPPPGQHPIAGAQIKITPLVPDARSDPPIYDMTDANGAFSIQYDADLVPAMEGMMIVPRITVPE
jgi:hypothetical protein